MILVTGASGYVGSHIIRKLLDAGRPVRGLVFNRDRAEQEGRLKGLDIDWVQGDVTRRESLMPALKDVTAVVHTVAIAIEKSGRRYEDINIQGTVNLINASKAAGVSRIIHISQLGSDSTLPYRFLASKGRAQEVVAASGLQWTSFTPSVIWGPEDEFANTFARLAKITPIIFPIVGDENSTFQPVWVEDVAACVVKALDDTSTVGKNYELGGPEVLTLEEIERRTLSAIGVKRVMLRFPMSLLKLAVTLMEFILPSPPVTRSLLELLSVPNVTTQNAITQFVQSPRPFTSEYAADYMRNFKVGDTITRFFGR